MIDDSDAQAWDIPKETNIGTWYLVPLGIYLVPLLDNILAKTISLSSCLIYLTDFLIENLELCVELDLMTY